LSKTILTQADSLEDSSVKVSSFDVEQQSLRSSGLSNGSYIAEFKPCKDDNHKYSHLIGDMADSRSSNTSQNPLIKEMKKIHFPITKKDL